MTDKPISSLPELLAAGLDDATLIEVSHLDGGGNRQSLRMSYGELKAALAADLPSIPGLANPLLLTEQTASNTALGGVRLYERSIANREYMGMIGSRGRGLAVQPIFDDEPFGVWAPIGNSATLPGNVGIFPFTATGTATARSVATTNAFTRQKRLGYVSAATAGSLAGARSPAAQLTTGDGNDLGGFCVSIPFGISDASFVANGRMFVGMSSSTGAPSDVEPSTLTNCIGVGHGAADTTMKLFYGGSSAQTPIDLGANFPANTATTDWYQLILFSDSTELRTINYELRRFTNKKTPTFSFSGTVSGTAAQVPSGTTLLTPLNGWRSNAAVASAVAIDFGPIIVR